MNPVAYLVAGALVAGLGLYALQQAGYVGKVEQQAETAKQEVKTVKEVTRVINEKRTEVIRESVDNRREVERLNAGSVANELQRDWARSSN